MKNYTTEFIGTFLWSLTAVLTLNNGSAAMAPLAIGSVLMVMVYAGGPISGGHYNPAVTMALLMRGQVDRGDAIYYIMAQLLGGAVAAFFAVFLLNCDSGTEIRPLNHTAACSVLAEFLGTFALVYVVLNVTAARSHPTPPYYGLAIGFTVTAMAYALGNISSGAFNPAVALGFSIAGMTSGGDFWMYLIGNLLGAAGAATVVGVGKTL